MVELVKEGKSPRTIHRKVSVYRTFVKFARRQGMMEANPAESVVLPKVEKRMPEVVPEHAMNKLFSEEVFSNDWKGRRDRSMMALLYETGIRMSELIGLKVGDVNGARREFASMEKEERNVCCRCCRPLWKASCNTSWIVLWEETISL